MSDTETIKALRAVARELSIFALEQTGGGSEMFKAVAGEHYADIVECRKRAFHRQEARDRVEQVRIKNAVAIALRERDIADGRQFATTREGEG